MSLNKEFTNVKKQVCDLMKESIKAPETEMHLSHNVLSLKGACENATIDINKSCSYLNKCTNETVGKRATGNTINVGRESVPLITSLKKLAVDVYNSDPIDISVPDIQEQIQNALSTSDDNLHHLQDSCKETDKFIENLELLIKHFKDLKNSNNHDSEISSFSHKDIITSSPIN